MSDSFSSETHSLKPTARETQTIDAAVHRRFQIALLLVVVSLPFVGLGAKRAVDGMRIAPERWVPTTQSERRQFDEFRQQFEGNDVVLISWDGCHIDDPRLHRFEQYILSPTDPDSAKQHERNYNRVVTGYSAIRRLTSPPLNLTREQAQDRLRGTLIGSDRKTSCALVVLTALGNEQRAKSIDRLMALAAKASGLERNELHVAGPPHDGMVIDAESVRGVNVFSKICTLVAALLCVWCLKSWRLTGVIIGVACFGQGIALSLVYYSGLTLDAILIVIPPLIFVLTVSAGVHLVNYYAAQSEISGSDNAVVRALRIGWKPCLLASVTTAIGLGSLAVSQITPIATFGVLSAVALLVTTVILLCILPGVMQRGLASPVKPQSATGTLRWERFATQVCRWAGGIAIACTATMLVSADGLRHLSASVNVLSLFSADSPVARDYRWFETHIGTTVPIEVVVDFDSNCPLGFRQRAELIRTVHDAVQHVDGIGGVVSVLTFAPEIPQDDGTASFLKTAAIYRRMEARRNEFIDQHYLYEDADQQSWRIGGRVSALGRVDYARLHNNLSEQVDPIIKSTGITQGIHVRYTGMMPLIQNIQTAILEDLFRSFLTAFALIALAIAIVLRNIRLTIAAMLPNLFPVLMIFGGMGWLGLPVDIGTVMTASVALGIAVDDTIHFLTCYRSQLASGHNIELAVRHAIQKSGRAMLQTTLICSMGMLVFSASAFVPTYRFGVIMALSLLTALLGDLVYLPAILTSRLGRWLVNSPGESMAASPARIQRPEEKTLQDIQKTT